MKKALIATALVTAFAAPAFAQTAAPAAAEEASPHTLTTNVGLFSSYRFRGIDQTNGKPALQGGFDYAHSSGFYAGNWNSNVSSGAGFPDGNLEMDFYAGYKTSFGDFGLDVGGILYYYPGSEAKALSAKADSGSVNNKELYVAGSWKFLTLKYSYSVDDYFSLRSSTGKETDGTGYLELNANYDLGNGWGVNGHVGQLNLKNIDNGDYTDWKIGVTKDLSGWVVGLAYVDTNAEGSCSKGEFYCFYNTLNDDGVVSGSTKDAGRGIAVLSVSRTF
ncbi:TorF family putative porin [Propionivibrio limicola]|uniref:TorF family putative porin n=1 Tax=Propionivibrio limicola TaxID=167645 RepID=UPI001290ED70|nr:TorF family putative porin [Propionivibrio limicola]